MHPAVLTALCAGPLHGYRLLERLAVGPTFAGKPPDATGVYRLLRALERGGYVSGAWEAPKTGPAKRLYRITPAGRRCLKRWIRVLDSYQACLAGLVAGARRAVSGNASKERHG